MYGPKHRHLLVEETEEMKVVRAWPELQLDVDLEFGTGTLVFFNWNLKPEVQDPWKSNFWYEVCKVPLNLRSMAGRKPIGTREKSVIGLPPCCVYRVQLFLIDW